MPFRDAAPRPAAPPRADELPRVSPWLFRGFARYSRWYLGRHFHALRLAGAVPAVPADRPLVVYFNHPAWWDPLVAIVLAHGLFGGRTHYGPIDAAALGSYGFFRRLGFFGVEPGVAGARRFLRVSEAVLARPATVLWITPEGHFTDPRERPVRLRPGLGRLARRLAARPGGAVFLPLAVEYPFWEERFPEALVHFGEAVDVAREGAPTGAAGASPTAWDDLLARRLEVAQDALATAARGRDPGAFETLLGGRAGVGGLYDLWRSLKARLRGERFDPEHGAVVRRPATGAPAGDGPFPTTPSAPPSGEGSGDRPETPSGSRKEGP